MGKTSIAWSDMSWNPIRARNRKTGKRGWFCTKIAPGCFHCYAESMNVRLGNGVRYAEDQADKIEFYLDEKALKEPLGWKKPQRVFPCSMTDMFHPMIHHDYIQAMFDVMEATPQHEYLCLTKRPEEIKSVLYGEEGQWYLGGGDYLKNVRLGVSVANQADADRNITTLLRVGIGWSTFVSYEPALGPIDFRMWVGRACKYTSKTCVLDYAHDCFIDCRGIDWIIVGGESGALARPFDIAWARSVIEQCKQSVTACFIKQLGSMAISSLALKPYELPGWERAIKNCDGTIALRLKDRKGENPEEWPEDVRVRQFPPFGESR